MDSLYWAIAFGVFAVAELIVPGLVTIWMALASLIMVVLSMFIDNVAIQVLIFLGFSLIFIVYTRPMLKKYLDTKNKTDFDSSVHGSMVEIINIKDQKFYEVKYKGIIWDASSKDIFKIGETAVIDKAEGNKLVIKKIIIE